MEEKYKALSGTTVCNYCEEEKPILNSVVTPIIFILVVFFTYILLGISVSDDIGINVVFNPVLSMLFCPNYSNINFSLKTYLLFILLFLIITIGIIVITIGIIAFIRQCKRKRNYKLFCEKIIEIEKIIKKLADIDIFYLKVVERYLQPEDSQVFNEREELNREVIEITKGLRDLKEKIDRELNIKKTD